MSLFFVPKNKHNYIAVTFSINYNFLHQTCTNSIEVQSINLFVSKCLIKLEANTHLIHRNLKSLNKQTKKIFILIEEAQSFVLNSNQKIRDALIDNTTKLIATGILNEVKRHYSSLYSQLIDFEQKESGLSEKEWILRQGMQLVKDQQSAELDILPISFDTENANFPVLLVSYFNPLPQNYATEYWVPAFVEQLQQHLSKLEVLVKNEQINAEEYQNIFCYLQNKKNNHYILLIGTSSLLIHYKNSLTKSQFQLDYLEKKPYSVIPILLYGQIRSIFPEYFFQYSEILDWRKKSYLFNLNQLISILNEDISDYLS